MILKLLKLIIEPCSSLTFWLTQNPVINDTNDSKYINNGTIFVPKQQDAHKPTGVMKKLSTSVPKKNRGTAKLHNVASFLVSATRALTPTLFRIKALSFCVIHPCLYNYYFISLPLIKSKLPPTKGPHFWSISFNPSELFIFVP